MELSTFKYNPNALLLGIIKKVKTKCPVCNLEREYVYDGPCYGPVNVDGLCPWCIADGSAAKKYDIEFLDSYDEVDQEKYIDELIHRTPGYTSWQSEHWLSHCSDFCALVQYVGWKEIEPLEEELSEDLENIYNEYHATREYLKDNLINNGDFQGYLFQCLHCNKHRLYVDSA